MSTDLYGIRILEVEPAARRIRMRVFVVYYDTHYKQHQPVPSDRSFFVRVLNDKDALGDDIAPDARYSEPWIDHNAFRYVERFVELERRNDPMASYEGYSDFYYERGGAWKDEDKLVQADYDVFVTEERYAAPFAAGQSWGTTAYPTRADGLTGEDYPHLPDFEDAFRSFVAFPEAAEEASVVDELTFSADSQRLLVNDNEGGFCVLSVPDGQRIVEVLEGRERGWDAGWTHDGRVAWRSKEGFVALDLETGGREAVDLFGVQASPNGERFLNDPDDPTVKILDRRGQALVEVRRPDDATAWAGFDADGRWCALAVEGGPLRLIDLHERTTRELPLEVTASSLSMSPDGRYVLASTYAEGFIVLRAEDGAVLRRWKPAGRIPTAVAWSPDGRRVATSSTDPQGYHSEITLHRIGREIEEAARQPLAVPPRAERDITDLARLYLERTRHFERGWANHLDDDRVDFHLALVRLGYAYTLDLVPHMQQPHAPILARAWEAILAAEAGDEALARAALADARARLEQAGEDPWWRTFVHAPLAVAHHLLGEAEAAAAELRQARAGGLDEESNPFQKRGALARALLWTGRTDEVRALIDEEAGITSLHTAHRRLLVDLIDRGELELLRHACAAWEVGQDWSTPPVLQRALLDAGRYEQAVSLAWLGLEEGRLSVADQVEAWLRWLAADPEAARARLAATAEGPVRAEVSRRLEARAATEAERPAAAEEAWAWLAERGRWEEVYAALSATKPTLREPMYDRIAEAARARGDIDIMLDALARLPCTDMNSAGLRALQRAFRAMAGPAYREHHI